MHFVLEQLVGCQKRRLSNVSLCRLHVINNHLIWKRKMLAFTRVQRAHESPFFATAACFTRLKENSNRNRKNSTIVGFLEKKNTIISEGLLRTKWNTKIYISWCVIFFNQCRIHEHRKPLNSWKPFLNVLFFGCNSDLLKSQIHQHILHSIKLLSLPMFFFDGCYSLLTPLLLFFSRWVEQKNFHKKTVKRMVRKQLRWSNRQN